MNNLTVSNPTLSVGLPVTAKDAVKKSNIMAKVCTLSLYQRGQELFTRKVEGKSLSESYAILSNIFHYQLKGKAVKLDKLHPVHLVLTFGEGEQAQVYKVDRLAKTNKQGVYIPYTASAIGSMLKDMYYRFAANIIEAATLQGYYFNYVITANRIASFTNIQTPATIPAKVITPKPAKAKK